MCNDGIWNERRISTAAAPCPSERGSRTTRDNSTFPPMKRRVVVTGMGALTPIGNNVGEFWAAALRGESGAAPITRFDATAFDTRFACEVKGFDALEHLDRKLAKRLD